MGTNCGVLGGGHVREVVARGKQSEGDDPLRLYEGGTSCICEGYDARIITLCGRYVPRWNVGGHALCECA
jgi:hypothetical protein